MIDVVCACGKRVRVADGLAGKKGRCSACGAVMRIPDAPDAGYDVDPEPLTPDPPEVKAPVAVTSGKVAPLVEPEPWYYGHLWKHAELMRLSVAVVFWGGFALLVLFTFGLVASGFVEDYPLQLVVTWVVGLVVLSVYRFFALTRAATLFLRVDEARNVRRVRLRAEL